MFRTAFASQYMPTHHHFTIHWCVDELGKLNVLYNSDFFSKLYIFIKIFKNARCFIKRDNSFSFILLFQGF